MKMRGGWKMQVKELHELLKMLVSLTEENEWVEFKCNNFNHEIIGELISALSNGACLHNQEYIYGDRQEVVLCEKKTSLGNVISPGPCPLRPNDSSNLPSFENL